MEAKTWMMIRILLNRYHQEASEKILSCLPRQEIQSILNQNIDLSSPELVLLQPNDLLTRIHYSWLAPLIETFPYSLRGAIIEALPKKHAIRIKKLLKEKIPILEHPLSFPIKKYLNSLLYNKFKNPDVLPLALLPKSSLSFLANLSKEEIVVLIDYLGIYDLAEDIKKIIDQKRLKQIQVCLTPQKSAFLNNCLHQKEKIGSSTVSIDKWDGKCDSLDQIIHQHGLLRLGKALCGQHPDFIWHFVHILDVGRGNLIKKYYSPAVSKGVTPVLVQQVIQVAEFLKPKK